MVSVLGALIALTVAIVLILRKVPPVYGMMVGAFTGALIGLQITEESSSILFILNFKFVTSVKLMMDGARGIIPAVMRILAAGVLAGVLIDSGGAKVIAETLVKKIGHTRSLFALAVATLILTAVGVFIDVAVITVAPIALAIAGKAGLSRMSILMAMIGGGKAGNMISPNPNAIAAADTFHIPLTSLMLAGLIPAIFGLIATYFIALKLKEKGEIIKDDVVVTNNQNLPNFFAALSAPFTAILLLSLRPVAGLNIDPMIALPLGGLIGAVIMGRAKHFTSYSVSGLGKMAGVAVMLLGTGTLAGVIANSQLNTSIFWLLNSSGLPAYLLAPVSGALMSLATASTTAGTSVASTVFGPAILELGILPLAAAAMVHTGATVFDHMPHGSFFHATGGAVHMDMKSRLKLIPYETLVGLVLTGVSTIIFGILKF